MPDRLHPGDPEVIRCPFGYFAQLHAGGAPAFDEGPAGHVVPGYDDLVGVTRDVEHFSNQWNGPEGPQLMGASTEPLRPRSRRSWPGCIASTGPRPSVAA